MKVKVSQKTLASALAAVVRVTPKGSTLPILSNVFVSAHDGQLQLTATDLEVTLTIWVKATIEDEGSTTVPASTFADLVKSLSDDQVSLTLAEAETLKVRCGGTRTQIKGISADEFPVLAVPDESGVKVSGETFREMVRQVVFAASTDEGRIILTGVLVKIEGDQITMAAVDGFRLAKRTATLEAPAETPFKGVVLKKALTEMAKVISDDDEVTITPMSGKIAFRAGSVEMVAHLIEGQFPAYDQVIPTSHETRTVISTPAFLKACEQAEIFARDGTKAAILVITPGEGETPGTVQVSGQSDETGSSKTVVDASIEGTPIRIGFNVRFLVDALKVVDAPNVILDTTVPVKPGTLRPVGDSEFVQVIMPMNIDTVVSPPIKNAAEA